MERCVIYLKKARDEGYQGSDKVKSDPSFATVIKDPAVQDFLEDKAPLTHPTIDIAKCNFSIRHGMLRDEFSLMYRPVTLVVSARCCGRLCYNGR